MSASIDIVPQAPPLRARAVHVRRPPATRRLVTAGLRAGRRTAPMYGLIDVDVTRAVELLAHANPPATLTAFVGAAVARAAAAHPQVHAYRDWRGRIVTHEHVDLCIIVEIETPDGPFTEPHVVRDADVRSAPDLTAELRQAKRAGAGGGRRQRASLQALRIPGTARLMYAVLARSVAARRKVGTVTLTSVGMFGGGSGFGLTPLTIMSLDVVVGGMTRRPRVVDGRIEQRDVLDLTVVIDHNLVDGAPAARFVADLRRLLETAAVLPQ